MHGANSREHRLPGGYTELLKKLYTMLRETFTKKSVFLLDIDQKWPRPPTTHCTLHTTHCTLYSTYCTCICTYTWICTCTLHTTHWAQCTRDIYTPCCTLIKSWLSLNSNWWRQNEHWLREAIQNNKLFLGHWPKWGWGERGGGWGGGVLALHTNKVPQGCQKEEGLAGEYLWSMS